MSSDVPTRRGISYGISLVKERESVGVGSSKEVPLPQGPSLAVEVFPADPSLGRPRREGKPSPLLSSIASCDPLSSLSDVVNTPVVIESIVVFNESHDEVNDSVGEIELVPEVEAWVVAMTWAWFGYVVGGVEINKIVFVSSSKSILSFLSSSMSMMSVVVFPSCFYDVFAGGGRWVSHVASLQPLSCTRVGKWSVLWWGCGERGRGSVVEVSAPNVKECVVFLNSSLVISRLGLRVCQGKLEIGNKHPHKVTLAPISGSDAELMYAQAFKQTFIISEFEKAAATMSDHKLGRRVLEGLTKGWSSGFRGKSFELLDRSRSLEPDEDQVLFDTLVKYRSKGYALGPFSGRPPFPTPQHPDVQPVVHMAFTRPKERWDQNPKLGPQRMIVHGSTPVYESFNDQTPRADSGYPYHTGEKFFRKVARGGKGALVMLIDGVDWYMQFPTPAREWGRQCLKVKGEFWVIIVGMFGSVYAGDNSNCMAQFLCNIGKEEY